MIYTIRSWTILYHRKGHQNRNWAPNVFQDIKMLKLAVGVGARVRRRLRPGRTYWQDLRVVLERHFITTDQPTSSISWSISYKIWMNAIYFGSLLTLMSAFYYPPSQLNLGRWRHPFFVLQTVVSLCLWLRPCLLHTHTHPSVILVDLLLLQF